MNAHFRRDYLYQFKQEVPNGIPVGVMVRYLKFDRKNKEYIFLEGDTKRTNELEIRVKHEKAHSVLARLNKLQWIGYDKTDSYLKGRKKVTKTRLVKESKPKQEDNILNITNVNQFEVGKVYRFECLDGFFISARPLRFLHIADTNIAIFEINSDRLQRLPQYALDNKSVSITLVE